MKKLIIALILTALATTACANNGESPDTSTPPFEEVEKIEVEISDYVEDDELTDELTETPVPTTTPSATANTPATQTPSSKPTQVAPQTPTPEQTPDSSQENDTQEPDNAVNKPVSLSGKIICIDPGHGIALDYTKTEKIAPDSQNEKAAFTEGTKGSEHIEDEITLSVGLKLKALLEEKGATVVMTRDTENTTMSNIERAQFANNSNADICIKLHADGTKEGGSGMTMLVPANKFISNSELISDSKRLGKAILSNAVSLTGARNRGQYANSQMAGFNWSQVPVVLFEMGFMTNPKDEKKLADDSYQNLIAQGILNGIMEYFN